MVSEGDEPLTPAGRMFVQPEMTQIINCVITGEHPFDVEAIRSGIRDSLILQLPRFCSLLVRDRRGREHWRKTPVDLDRHIIVRHEPVGDGDDGEEVNDYLADLSVSSPLSLDKPLWEVHLLMAHNCAVFRIHHALGDGISLMSMLMSCCRRTDDPTQPPTFGLKPSSSSAAARGRREWKLWRVSKSVWFTLVFMTEFVLRSMWLRDKKTAVSGGAGVELWPRKAATASFRLDDMKAVKEAVAGATINDVLFGVISSGLSRYLDIRSSKGLKEGIRITGIAMVNLRPISGLQDLSKLMTAKSSGTRWGNKFGMMLLPIYYHKAEADPLQFVKRAKEMIDRKKLSLEAIFSYKLGDFVMSLFGPKVASMLNYRIVSNTTFTISNVIGPQEEITLTGNPVTSIKTTSSSLPHAITMHMVSYAGRADMQILVAKDIIPDPRVLAKCFQDALIEMKEAANLSKKA